MLSHAEWLSSVIGTRCLLHIDDDGHLYEWYISPTLVLNHIHAVALVAWHGKDYGGVAALLLTRNAVLGGFGVESVNEFLARCAIHGELLDHLFHGTSGGIALHHGGEGGATHGGLTLHHIVNLVLRMERKGQREHRKKRYQYISVHSLLV